MKAKKATREQVIQARSRITELAALFQFGLSKCQELQQHFSTITGHWAAMEIAEMELDALEELYHLLQERADLLNRALAVAASAAEIIRLSEREILSEEEGLNLLERVREGDMGLYDVLKIVEANRTEEAIA